MSKENIQNLILSPDTIKVYLINNNWQLLKQIDGSVSIWGVIGEDQKEYTIWLPLNPKMADYRQNIATLLQTVAVTKKTTQEQIAEDLDLTSTGDVIRLAAWDQFDRNSASILFNDGFALFQRGKNLITAAALATQANRSVFPNYRPPEITNYLNKVRLGQTERSSYLIKIISPISNPTQPLLIDTAKIPFERSVIIKLMKSLELIHQTARHQINHGGYNFEQFHELVGEGVSANLCEAVANFNEKQVYDQPFKIDVNWSLAIDRPEEEFQPITFDKETLPYIAKAAEEFREKHPEHIKISGLVSGLTNDPKKKLELPKIVLKAVFEDKERKVHISLSPRDYDIAIDAHKNEQQISIRGELKRNGSALYLTEPYDLKVIPKENQNLLE